MSARAIPSRSPAHMLALGLGLATIIAFAVSAKAAEPSQPEKAGAAVGFVCQAAKGGWCDLRDWSGMDRWPVPSAAHAEAQG